MKKKLARHRITFEDPNDLEAVVLAKLGFGNDLIRERSSLSNGQIQYRLTKAKTLEGLPTGEGYRKQWRTGSSQLAHDVLAVMVPRLRTDAEKTLPKLVAHPTPKIVAAQEPTKAEIAQQVKALIRQRARAA